MKTRRQILLIDSEPADRALTSVVLRQRIPDIDLVEIGDPLDFADRLAEGDYAAVVAEQTLSWGQGLHLLQVVRKRCPGCQLFLFARALPSQIASIAISHGLTAYLPKTSEGFLDLPEAVRAGLESAERRRNNGALRQMVDALPVGILSLSSKGRIVGANPAAVGLLGAASEAILTGSFLTELLPSLADSRAWGELIGGAHDKMEGVFSRVGEADRRLKIEAWAVQDRGGSEHAFDAVLQDVRQTVEEGGESRIKRLSEELEQLAYAVSHDLQEPLQLVSRNAKLLVSRYGDSLDADAGRFLGHLVDSSDRMQNMIDGVLTYSRLGPAGVAAPTDLRLLVDEAVANLRPLLEEAGAEVHTGPMPTLTVNGMQFRQVFQNLIGNALKFRGGKPLRVSIDAAEEGSVWRFAVKDNGIGIDPKFQERIFGMFQRLHTAEEYPGTGIGLAICKRIVVQHGGSIWVRSQPGAGASFYFTVPK